MSQSKYSLLIQQVLEEAQRVPDSEVEQCLAKGEVKRYETDTSKLVPLELRKLDFLLKSIIDKYNQLVRDLMSSGFQNKDNVDDSVKEELLILKGKIDIIDKIFWFECRNFLGVMNRGTNIGIRAGWKLVTYESEPEIDIMDLMSGDIDCVAALIRFN